MVIDFSIAKDFSRTPGSRYEREGAYSAELLLAKLNPIVADAIPKGHRLDIDTGLVAGIGAGFMNELVFGLCRQHDWRNVVEHVRFWDSEGYNQYVLEAEELIAEWSVHQLLLEGMQQESSVLYHQ